MANAQQTTVVQDPARVEFDVQLALAQVHGALHHAVTHADHWLTDASEAGVTLDDVRNAYRDVCPEFGTAQAILNGEELDARLRSAGLAGFQGAAKFKGLVAQVRRFCRQVPTNTATFVGRMVPALRWSSTILGSVCAALQGEATRFPGAATAVEAIREFAELVLNTASIQPPKAGAAQKAKAE